MHVSIPATGKDHADDVLNDEDLVDARLIAAIASGDEEALIRLYRRRRQDVYRYAYTMSRSTTLAEDAMHDAFINIIERANRFDPERGSVRAWLIGCVRYRLLDRLRETAGVVDEAVEITDELDLADLVDRYQSTVALHAAISELPPKYREVLVLCELEELSYAEVAGLLDCPIGTVRSRLARARKLLVAMLEPQSVNGSSAPANCFPEPAR